MRIIHHNATVNDYFVNMLELGSDATSPDLVYLSLPNLPSTYVFALNNFLGCISLFVSSFLLNNHLFFLDLSVRVLSQRETEQRYRQLGRHDQLRTYRCMMGRRNRRARRRSIANQTPQHAQSTSTNHTVTQSPQQITPLNPDNQPQNQQQNQTLQQTPYTPNQMGRYTPYRRRNRQNERYRNEHIEDRTCFICYMDMLRGEYTDVCLTCEYRFHKPCIRSWFMYNRNRTCPMYRATFMQSPTTFVLETPSPPPLIDLENINVFSPSLLE